MATTTLPRPSALDLVRETLDLPEIRALIDELEQARETGRRGYGSRALLGGALVKAYYVLPTWSRTARLIDEHEELQHLLGARPSVFAFYRFASRMRGRHKAVLDRCIGRVIAGLQARLPQYGQHLALDATDAAAWANGMRYRSKNGPLREKFSDPHASWGHRSSISTRKGGGFFGYRIHAAVCAETDLPVAWLTVTAKTNESTFVADLLHRARAVNFKPTTAAADKGYDLGPVYDACERAGVRPIIPLRATDEVVRGEADPPICIHGLWAPAGADTVRKRLKWRCPAGECNPKSIWRKASRLHPLIPRESKRWRDLYRRRAAVERCFARLKEHYGLTPLRVRGLERVALHTDLTMLALLAHALARARAARLAA